MVTMKPIARGYIHLATFFIILCPCMLLLFSSNGPRSFFASVIYSGSLIMQYAVSAAYHTHTWSRKNYLILRRIDHAAIFFLIAGTATPICLLKLKSEVGLQLLSILWLVALTGMIITSTWPHVPKWTRALLYIVMGWIGVFYLPEIKSSLDMINIELLVWGGIMYTVGALIYAFKWPDPFPAVFGYHELFHIFVVCGTVFHFVLNYNIAVT